MKTWTITESKTPLSALVEQVVATGRPVVIGRSGKPMVQLVTYIPKNGVNRRVGVFNHRIRMAADFDLWDDEEARALGIKD